MPRARLTQSTIRKEPQPTWDARLRPFGISDSMLNNDDYRDEVVAAIATLTPEMLEHVRAVVATPLKERVAVMEDIDEAIKAKQQKPLVRHA